MKGGHVLCLASDLPVCHLSIFLGRADIYATREHKIHSLRRTSNQEAFLAVNTDNLQKPSAMDGITVLIRNIEQRYAR